MSTLRVLAFLIVVGFGLCAAAEGPAFAGDSPGTARVLSVLLPGAGHMYAGEGMTGLGLLATYASTLSLAIATNPGTWAKADSADFFTDISEETPTSTKLIFWGSAAATAAVWLYGVIDAPKAVRRQLALVPTMSPNGVQLAARITF